MEDKEIKFIDRIYKDLHTSDEVLHTAEINDTKNIKINKYFDRLERIENKAKENNYNDLDKLKNLFYKKYVIKKENIPEAYYELQRKIALERGLGHLEINETKKEELANTVIENQKASLDEWLDYLIINEANYPEWFKYYAFQGMLKLGIYDKGNYKFSKRTQSTTAKFVDLNYEALAKIYNGIVKVINNEEIDDDTLKRLINNGSFSKLYAYELRKMEKNDIDIINSDGIWIKYNRGDDPKKLVDSLQGKGTGWCTAGYSTAKSQLNNGDFFVYYTKDSTGEYRQPRIAIRMEADSIGEIRGIGTGQNLEPEMKDVLKKKLEEFPDKDKYYKKVHDMEKLTKIYNEHKERELEIDELSFLYTEEISGFGYKKDPRIQEIINNRSNGKDLSKLFSSYPNAISGGIKCKFKNIDGAVFPKIINGDLILKGTSEIKNIVFPEEIRGNLYLDEIVSYENITFPKKVNGTIDLSQLKSMKDTTFPEEMMGILKLDNVTSAKNIKFPKKLNGSILANKLIETDNLTFPEEMTGSLFLNSIKDIKELTLPKKIGNNLVLSRVKALENISFPKEIGGLYLNNVKEINNVVFPEIVRGSFTLEMLEYAENLVLPKEIGGELGLFYLKKQKNLVLPQKVYSNVWLNSMQSGDGMVLPEFIGGQLQLGNMKDLNGITLPKKIKGNLILDGLTDIKNIKFNEVDEIISLENVKSAENVEFPKKTISIYLNKLEIAHNVIMPKYMSESLRLTNLKDASGIVLPEKMSLKYGYLDLRGLLNADNIILPKEANKIDISQIKKANNLVFPQIIDDTLNIDNLETLDGIVIPEEFQCKNVISKNFTIDDLNSKSTKKSSL